MVKPKRGAVINPFETATAPDLENESLTIEEVDRQIYGDLPLQDVGRKPVKKIPIEQITPDPAQPRRTVPKSVIKEAKAAGIPVWQAWHRIAGRLVGKPIDLKSLLRGEGEGAETDPLGIPLVIKFLELVGLAATIYREGLSNPISIFAIGPNRYQIESGEGRWLSHMMLHNVLDDDKWSKIDAIVVSEFDVWRQASENGARRPLNAISTARQLALLIMDLYRGKDGISILPYGQMIQEGDVDRKFYEQVSNGNVYRIPKGQGERIIQAIGLKSRSQMAHYRALLDIPDDVWVKADEEDWKEFTIREHMASLKPRDTFTDVNVSPQNGANYRQVQVEIPPMPGAPIPPREPQGPGTKATGRMMKHYGATVELVRTEGTIAIVHSVDANGIRGLQKRVPVIELKDITFAPSDAERAREAIMGGDDEEEFTPTISTAIKQDAGIIPNSNPTPSRLIIGQTYQNTQGHLFKVMSLEGDKYRCAQVSPTSGIVMPGFFRMSASELLPLEPAPSIKMPPSAQMKPLPDWAQPGRMVKDISTNETGKVLDAHWNGVRQDWYLRIAFLETTGQVPLGMLEANDPTPILPEWAEIGKQVRHKDTGKVGTVVQTALNVNDNEWWLQVDIHQEGIADALLTEFEALDLTQATEAPAPAAPRERHSALHPSRINGVIVQEQHLTGLIQEMARRLEMPQNESLVRGMQTMTAIGLKSRMRQSGRAGVEEWLNTIHSAGIAVLGTMAAKLDVIHLNAKQVLDDIEAEQQGE